MISRIYTVEHHHQLADGSLYEDVDAMQAFKGFNDNFVNCPVIASVFVDGVCEVWALDDTGPAVEELKKFYAFEGEEVLLITVYERKLVNANG